MYDLDGLSELQILGRTLKVLIAVGLHAFVNVMVTMAMVITNDPAITAFASTWKLTSLAVGIAALSIAIWKRWYYPLLAVTLVQLGVAYLAAEHINGM